MEGYRMEGMAELQQSLATYAVYEAIIAVVGMP